MAKFIELHDEKNHSLFVNIEEISLIKNRSNCCYNVTDVKMRDGFIFKIMETKEEIRDILSRIR